MSGLEHLHSQSRDVQRSWIGLLAVAVVLCIGCNRDNTESFGARDAVVAKVLSPAEEQLVVSFCGDCHAMPLASSFPKEAWQAEVDRGYAFYFASGRTDLPLPNRSDVRQYFVSRAPDEIVLSPPERAQEDFQAKFSSSVISLPDIPTPAISFVGVVDPGGNLGSSIVLSEMRNGGVYLIPLAGNPRGAAGAPFKIAQVDHPAAIVMDDWDQDGFQDFIVSDLGTFLPGDHDLGRVVWLRQRPDQPGTFETHTLLSGLGRVSSAVVADFNSDGVKEILVAEFGWHDTGSIFLATLANVDRETGSAVDEEDNLSRWTTLQKKTIDLRSGSIHVCPLDLNEDGHLDFVGLISQEFELINAYINDGTGQFRDFKIYAAPDPAFGSSGIDLCDVNGDGLKDILYTNGDSFDSFSLKPHHGVRWLENPGWSTEQTWPVHELGPLPGAHRAVGGLLFDGKLPDIVGGAFIPKELIESNNYIDVESLVVWTPAAGGGFTKRVLSNDEWNHASIKLFDLTGDGRDEILVGHFREAGMESGAALTIYQLRDDR